MSEIASWLFLGVSLWGSAFTFNVYRPIAGHERLAVVSFIAGWLTSELALHHIIIQALFTAGFVWAGALQHWPGMLGMVITLGSWFALAYCFGNARTTSATMEAALAEGLPDYERADFEDDPIGQVEWREVLFPLPLHRSSIERVRNVTYARVRGLNLKLDVYRGWDKPDGCPVLLQIHGGAWVLGTKNDQGVPLMRRMARRGWVCVSVDYRLSPHATFPEHLIDLKRAIAWVREHIHEYGGDPNRIVATGGSAGGHLCALIGLTANDPRYQPGFEDVDTSTIACIPFYGVYDFTNRYSHWPNRGLARILERQVMKSALDEAREDYEAASPMSRIHDGAPPFLIIHGTHDTLVPVEEARQFARMLRAVSREPVVYAEIAGAQHAFEIFPSLRADLVLKGVERFLAWAVAHDAQCRSGVAEPEAAQPLAMEAAR
jgi:acetyl esterase/lipase